MLYILMFGFYPTACDVPAYAHELYFDSRAAALDYVKAEHIRFFELHEEWLG